MCKYLKWFSKVVRPHRASIAVMMLCHVLLAGCSVGFVFASKKLVDIAVAVLQGGSEHSGLWLSPNRPPSTCPRNSEFFKLYFAKDGDQYRPGDICNFSSLITEV